jgi:hypothetical protein
MLDYPPFAIKDSTKTGDAVWSGIDVDLLAYIAKRANFTYSLFEIHNPGNETWDVVAERASHQSDLVTSWWTHTAERRRVMVQLTGHIDASVLLLKDNSIADEEGVASKAWDFLKPFTWDLWLVIFLGIIPLTGCQMVLLESRLGHPRSDFARSASTFGAVFKSIYLAMIAFNDQGGHEPHTPSGRVFLIVWGVTVMITTAALTAELAAFLTDRSESANADAFSTAAEAERKQIPVCVSARSTLLRTQTRISYSAMGFELRNFGTANVSSYEDAAQKLLMKDKKDPQVCKALLLQKPSLDIIRTMPNYKDYCDITVAGAPTSSLPAGWLTGKEHPCVAYTVDYYMQEAVDTGEVVRLLNKWQGKDLCPKVTVSTTDHAAERLTIEHFGGLFAIFLAAATFFAVLQFLIDLYIKWKYGGDQDKSGISRTASVQEMWESEDEETYAARAAIQRAYGDAFGTHQAAAEERARKGELGARALSSLDKMLLSLQRQSSPPASPGVEPDVARRDSAHAADAPARSTSSDTVVDQGIFASDRTSDNPIALDACGKPQRGLNISRIGSSFAKAEMSPDELVAKVGVAYLSQQRHDLDRIVHAREAETQTIQQLEQNLHELLVVQQFNAQAISQIATAVAGGSLTTSLMGAMTTPFGWCGAAAVAPIQSPVQIQNNSDTGQDSDALSRAPSL